MMYEKYPDFRTSAIENITRFTAPRLGKIFVIVFSGPPIHAAVSLLFARPYIYKLYDVLLFLISISMVLDKRIISKT